MRTTAEIAVGVLYAIGAIFNTSYTLRHSRQFYGEFAEKAWFRPAGQFIARLIVPNGKAFTVLLVLFQLMVSAAILTRGDFVVPALAVGGTFAAVVALFSSRGGAVGNILLAVIQFALAAA